jgi:hypothetical protein
MVIRILDIVPGADTAEQGDLVYGRLQFAFANSGPVTVSFDGLNIATSSFGRCIPAASAVCSIERVN